VIETKPQQSAVLSHYEEIAATYKARANSTCEQAYRCLVARFMAGRRRLLEIGAGCSDLLGSTGSPTAVACDLSLEMLRRRSPADPAHRVAAVGERLPFGDARFDAVFSINVLEHVADLDRMLAETVRVLAAGGVMLAVTPNGNWEALLDLAERWSLKIPEGPHEFLTTRRLHRVVERHLEVVEHRTILMLPAGPAALSSWVDAVSLCSAWGGGFFQYIVARKRAGAEAA
jgi:ubiquinone/menaquinone biosynthesis C-methylase UbiE